MRLYRGRKHDLAWVAVQPELIAMSALLNNPAHWHLRAEETRVLAQHLTDPVANASIHEIADEYDRLALRAAVRMQGQDEIKTG